jgi:ubiquinone/menaquinone biosynthesis C-methylase UbiE
VRTEAAYGPIAPAGGDTATPLNLAKRLRVVERYAAVHGKRVVDCGCGAGEYVAALQSKGASAWGIEFSQAKVASSKSNVPGRLSVGDLQQIALRSDTVDIALLNEVLEHVPDEARALREVHRILRPGGMLLVFSPNRRYPFETHGARFRQSGRRMPHYLPLVPYVPLRLSRTVLDFWARNYWPGELRQMVRQAGFTITGTDYVWQTFEGISSHQPRLIGRSSAVLRRIANLLERLPLLRSLGVSQVIVATKAETGSR